MQIFQKYFMNTVKMPLSFCFGNAIFQLLATYALKSFSFFFLQTVGKKKDAWILLNLFNLLHGTKKETIQQNLRP